MFATTAIEPLTTITTKSNQLGGIRMFSSSGSAAYSETLHPGRKVANFQRLQVAGGYGGYGLR